MSSTAVQAPFDYSLVAERLSPEISLTKDQVYMLLIGGGSASGKTTVARFVAESLRGKSIAMISQDNFYAQVTDPAKRRLIEQHKYNFDHPDAIDFDLLHETLLRLKHRQAVDIPIYDFNTSRRVPGEFSRVEPADVIVVEGIFALFDPRIRRLANLSIFVETDSDLRLARRIRRDMQERGRSVESVLSQYLQFVKDAHDSFIEPTKRYADVVLPNTACNGIELRGLQMVVRHLHAELELRSVPPSEHTTPTSSPPNERQ